MHSAYAAASTLAMPNSFLRTSPAVLCGATPTAAAAAAAAAPSAGGVDIDPLTKGSSGALSVVTSTSAATAAADAETT